MGGAKTGACSGLGNSRFFDELGLAINHEMDWEDSLEHAGYSSHFKESGVKHGPFALALLPIDQPSRDLVAALAELDVDPENFQIIGPGDSRELNTGLR